MSRSVVSIFYAIVVLKSVTCSYLMLEITVHEQLMTIKLRVFKQSAIGLDTNSPFFSFSFFQIQVVFTNSALRLNCPIMLIFGQHKRI